MKSDRTLYHSFSSHQRDIQKMGIELQIHRGVQKWHEAGEALTSQNFVRRTHVGKCAATEMLQFQHLSDKEITVIHEGGKLGGVGSQLFDNSGAVDNMSIIDI